MRKMLMDIIQDPDFPEHRAWRRRAFAANQLILREGESDRHIYIVEHGSLRVSARVELENHRHIQPGLADLGPGDLFGEFSLFEPRPRTASVIAIDPVSLVEIDCEHLSRYLDHNPAVGYAFLKALYFVLVDRLGRANQRVEHLIAWGLKVHDIDKHL